MQAVEMNCLRCVEGCSETARIKNGKVRAELGVLSLSQTAEENGDKLKECLQRK
jgi:hypothetical protein